MHPQPAAASTSLLEDVLADNQWLEGLLEQIRTASEVNDGARLQKLRAEFERDLSAHLKAEEAFLIPALLRSGKQGAHTLLEDHKLLRTRLAELTVGVDVEFVRPDAVYRFIDDLRSHARHGDRLFNQLAA